MNEEISIVGAAGFLGTRLSKILKREDFTFNSYDIDDKHESVKKIDVESLSSVAILKNSSTIINLAAVHRDDVKPVSKYDDVNVTGALNICQVASENKVNKIIFASSVAIYGFTKPNTDELGEPNYFNDYGRTKFEAEQIYKNWYLEDPNNRTLIIIRPTVIFGEGNRGNVYNLLNQINSNRFLMIGNGKNIKSMAYVENVAAFIEHSLCINKGFHVFNYVDKPDMNMNTLISTIRKTLFNKSGVGIRVPIFLGYLIGYLADIFSKITGVNLPVSSIRIKKFLATTQFSTSIQDTDFKAPFKLNDALIKTIRYEFLDKEI